MGMIKELLLLPVAPARGVVWVSEKIAEQAERERYSDAAAIKRLDELERKREAGEIDEQRAKELEDELIQEQLTRVPEGENGHG
jgi:Gas vesicle protein G